MKRFHVHLHVNDLSRSIGFYSQLFAAQPTRIEPDYAKWMLDEPAVNFAISTRGAQPGIDHLGFQTDDPAELATLKARAQAADLALLDQGETTCCYARSEKHWVTDPQGIAWEHFHTLADIPVFSQSSTTVAAVPAAQGAPDDKGAACCGPMVTPAAAVLAASALAVAGKPGAAGEAAACCPPARRGKPIDIPVRAGSGCC